MCWFNGRMWNEEAVSVPKAQRGGRVAILSPAFAAPAVGAAVHEQAMQRLVEVTGLIPVEYPTTRELGASAAARAADVNAAFGDDQITVIPHLDLDVIAAHPKPFLGYSDNTNLHNVLWQLGIPSFYGGSTQVHFGAGPAVDSAHLHSFHAAVISGGTLELTEPGESEDYGRDWNDPLALTQFGEREVTVPWVWAGPSRIVSGRSWGGCLEVIDQLAMADRLPSLQQLTGAILLLETSEELPEVAQVRRWVRALGERGLLGVISGVLVARPPVTALEGPSLSAGERERLRAEQCEVIVEQIAAYNADAVVCVGVPFGHTRPQVIIPHGGCITLDGVTHTVTADYS